MDPHVIKSKFHAFKALLFQLWKNALIEKMHLQDSNLLLKVHPLRPKHLLFLKRNWTQFVNGNWVKTVLHARLSNHHVMRLELRNHNLRDAQREVSFLPDLQKHQRLLLPKMVPNKKIKLQELAKMANWWNKTAWLSQPEIKLIHLNIRHQLLLNKNWTQFASGNWVKMVLLASLSNLHAMRLELRSLNLKDAQKEASFLQELPKHQRLLLPKMVPNRKIKLLVSVKMANWWNKTVWLSQPEIK